MIFDESDCLVLHEVIHTGSELIVLCLQEQERIRKFAALLLESISSSQGRGPSPKKTGDPVPDATWVLDVGDRSKFIRNASQLLALKAALMDHFTT